MPELSQATSSENQSQRLALILWGDAGTFKSTIASTGRGNKLWISFDNGALDSVKGLKAKISRSHPDLDTALKNDIYELDYSKEDKVNYVAKFESSDSSDPLGITKYLTNQDMKIKTVVIDSLTTLGDDVLEFCVKYKGYKANNAPVTMTNPGMQAYGARLIMMKMFFQAYLKLTAKYNVDIIFISHAKDVYDEEVLQKITLAIGGNVATEIGIKIGEIWYVSDNSKGRTIHFAPFQKYQPMKTRMFDKSEGKPTSFIWKYDIKNPDPRFEIARWFSDWENNGYDKIEVPK